MFAELLGRSCFSFLEGASQPEELVEEAHSLGLAALALCDAEGLYGSVRAHARAEQLGQRVIVGAELSIRSQRFSSNARSSVNSPPHAVNPGSNQETSPDPSSFESALAHSVLAKSVLAKSALPKLALLVQDRVGYVNLCRLLTLAHAAEEKGTAALPIELLAHHAEGLFAVLPAPARPGEDASLLAGDARELASLSDAFGSRFALAVHRHLDEWDAARHALVKGVARRWGLPIVATARPLYHQRSRKALADVLYCIRHGLTLDRVGARLPANREAVLRSPQAMRKLFADHPSYVERTLEIADSMRFSLAELEYRFPCSLEAGETADEKLARLVRAGAARRYPGGVPPQVTQQLERELALIAQLDVAPYFLSTWEVVEIAREKRILCQGRGSAANSAVCYVLGITAVDPARSSLLFERFMSPERREPPDIDIDFEHERREEVIQEIYARYGRERAAMVSEVICYRGKSSLREVGKVFGLSLEQVDRLSSSINFWDSGSPSWAEAVAKRLKELGFDERDQRLRQVVQLAQELNGFPRHLSIHVGGFVLSAEPLHHVAPVEPARMPGRTVIPWDKDDLDALGFFKIDVLGLGMLTAIRKCLALLHEDGELYPLPGPLSGAPVSGREPFDPLESVTRIPPEDPSVYRMISRADTVGVFQIESRAQMAMLPRLRPRSFYDLVIEVAIVRPGPIQGGMVHPYLRRRNGEEPVTSHHRDLDPILDRTLGVPLFQEQVMQIAITGAGYSGGEADQLRRDMAAWKKSGRLLGHRDRLLAGFRKKGISPEFGEALFEQIKGFGEYGFPESHAASFALLVYASAWQKAHFPAHFACALLNAQPMGFYSPSALVQDAQRHGVEVRDVCVLASRWDSTLEKRERGGRALRLGLRLVKGLGEAAARRIEAARAAHVISSVEDLIERAELKKNEIEALGEAGALEVLVEGRRQALWNARAPRVGGLFSHVRLGEPEVKLPKLRAAEQLVLDYGRKGLSVNDHPLRHMRAGLERRSVRRAADLNRLPQGTRVAVAGLVTCRQMPATASGVVFFTLEDETGSANLIVYRNVYEAHYLVARHAVLLLAWGKVERDPKAQGEVPVVHVIVSDFERLDTPNVPIDSLSRDFH
jgi:error-prone DNA polymerase